jgi:hypothetical protein
MQLESSVVAARLILQTHVIRVCAGVHVRRVLLSHVFMAAFLSALSCFGSYGVNICPRASSKHALAEMHVVCHPAHLTSAHASHGKGNATAKGFKNESVTG